MPESYTELKRIIQGLSSMRADMNIEKSAIKALLRCFAEFHSSQILPTLNTFKNKRLEIIKQTRESARFFFNSSIMEIINSIDSEAKKAIDYEINKWLKSNPEPTADITEQGIEAEVFYFDKQKGLYIPENIFAYKNLHFSEQLQPIFHNFILSKLNHSLRNQLEPRNTRSEVELLANTLQEYLLDMHKYPKAASTFDADSLLNLKYNVLFLSKSALLTPESQLKLIRAEIKYVLAIHTIREIENDVRGYQNGISIFKLNHTASNKRKSAQLMLNTAISSETLLEADLNSFGDAAHNGELNNLRLKLVKIKNKLMTQAKTNISTQENSTESIASNTTLEDSHEDLTDEPFTALFKTEVSTILNICEIKCRPKLNSEYSELLYNIKKILGINILLCKSEEDLILTAAEIAKLLEKIVPRNKSDLLGEYNELLIVKAENILLYLIYLSSPAKPNTSFWVTNTKSHTPIIESNDDLENSIHEFRSNDSIESGIKPYARTRDFNNRDESELLEIDYTLATGNRIM